jgi:hypothetical protein
MSEEISAGVRILLERAKSNPEEMAQEYGKWHQLRDAVYAYKEDGQRRAWIRGLRQDEIDLLYEAFCTGSRQIFDDYVLKNVLGADEEKEEYVGQAALNNAMAKRGLLAKFPPPVIDPNYNPYQNAIQPGQIVPIATTQTSTTSLVTRLKQELGIK